MAACAGIGSVLFDDWVDWVLKVITERKVKTFNPLSGVVSVTIPATLPSLLKQDPNWTSSLPSNLRLRLDRLLVYRVRSTSDFDDVLTVALEKPMDNVIEFEPLPDASQVNVQPKKSDDDMAKQREQDVDKVKEILMTCVRMN